MCGEGVDLVTLKISLKQEADRLRLEQDILRQWAALAANVNLEDISRKLQQGYQDLSEAEELLREAVLRLAEAQVGEGGTGGVTVTPV